MVILYCYAKPFAEPREALQRYAPDAKLIDTSGSDFAYWDAIREHWTGEDDLVTVEQDIVITGTTMPSFEACRHDWCYFGYNGDSSNVWRLEGCLGCTRFSKQLQREIPASDIAEWIMWFSVDARIADVVKQTYTAHDHGDVRHLHPYAFGPRDPHTVQAPLPSDHDCAAEKCAGFGYGTHFYSWYGLTPRGDGSPGAAHANWAPKLRDEDAWPDTATT